MTRRLLALVLVVAAGPGRAADPPARPGGLEYTPPAPPAAADPAGLVTRLFGLTAGVLVLCGGVVWAARRAKRAPAGVGGNGRLAHEGSLALDRRSAVHLIRADGHTVAVTTDATGLRSLVVLTDPFDPALDDAADRAAGPGATDEGPLEFGQGDPAGATGRGAGIGGV